MTFPAIFELSNLNGTNGFAINGINAFNLPGIPVSSAGDVNSDGFDDLIIGVPYASPNGLLGAGQSYVVFGKSDGFSSSLNLSTLNGTNGFAINGINRKGRSGTSVSNAGDINDDGFDDLIIGEPYANLNGILLAGRSYVVFGKSGGFSSSLNLSILNGTNGFVINGINGDDASGFSVSNAGDVNGDGFDDLIIGAPDASPNGLHSGQSYVVFGKSGGFSSSLNLSTLNGTNGFAINGINGDDASGFSVSNAGDVNGDGFDDLIIGAPGADFNGSNSGQSYVVFGKSGGFGATINLSTLDGTNGFAINGIEYQFSSQSVSNAGDINGDGFDDLIIDGKYTSISEASRRLSSVVFGKSGGFSSSLNLSTLNGTNGFAISSSMVDFLNASVSGAGDVNGDGFDDLIIGGVSSASNNVYLKYSYVVFGKGDGFGASFNLSTLNGSNGFVISGIDANDSPNVSIGSAGDVNGDGFDDLIIGAPGADFNGLYSGQSYVVFGRATLPSITLAVSPSSVAEDNLTNLIYTFTRTGDLTLPLTVDYGITGTATNSIDYGNIGTSVTFAANSDTATVTVNPIADADVEDNETVVLTLASGTEYTIGTTTPVIGTITNDDAKPEVSVSDSWVEVNENQNTAIKFRVTLSQSSDQPVTIVYSTSDETATSNGQDAAKDYESITDGILTFAPGETTKEVEIIVYGERGVTHRDFEIFAKDTAYRNWVKGQDVDKIPLINSFPYGDLGYYVDQVFNDSVTDFQAVGLTSDENFSFHITTTANATISDGDAEGTIYDLGKAPVLASRGTAGGQDIFSDANPGGVGFNQYSRNKDNLETWLANVSQAENGAVTFRHNLTGHSLGGALTQWIAANYTGDLGEVVTFNSPGISFGGTPAANIYNTTHYVTSSDIVSMAGYQFLPGSYVLSDYTSGILGVLDTHLVPTIGPRVGYTETNVTNWQKRPLDLITRSPESANKLSNFFFTYLPDPDYFAIQIAVALISSDLAKDLTFRGTVEANRIALGSVIYSAAFINNLASPIVQAALNAASQFSSDVWNTILQSSKNALNIIEKNDTVFSVQSSSNINLEQGLQIAQGFLQNFANASDFTTKMNLAFGDNWDTTVAQNLAQAWANGNFSNLPPIEIVPASEIDEANGAFSISRSTIYLASEYLNSATSPEAVANVLLEEIGHFVDLQINELDSPGDEGEIFAALVQNAPLSDTELQALKAENDLVVLPGERSPWESMAKWTVGIWNASLQWDTQTFTNALEGINTPPVVENPILDRVATEDTPFSFTFAETTFTEIDIGDSLTYSATLANGNALPGWLNFNPTNRTFSGTPPNTAAGTYNISVTATDTAGDSASDIFSLTVADRTESAILRVKYSGSILDAHYDTDRDGVRDTGEGVERIGSNNGGGFIKDASDGLLVNPYTGTNNPDYVDITVAGKFGTHSRTGVSGNGPGQLRVASNGSGLTVDTGSYPTFGVSDEGTGNRDLNNGEIVRFALKSGYQALQSTLSFGYNFQNFNKAVDTTDIDAIVRLYQNETLLETVNLDLSTGISGISVKDNLDQPFNAIGVQAAQTGAVLSLQSANFFLG